MHSLPCPNCDYRNTAEARFCNECGSKLRLKPCPSCAHRPTAALQTCSACGVFRPEESLLEVEPALELPVLEDQLLEEAYFDVPMLKDTWTDSVTPVEPVEPVAVSAGVPQIKSSVPALPATVPPNQSVGVNRARNPALAVMFGLAAFVIALVGLIYFFLIPGTTEPAAVSVQAPPAQATVTPVPAVPKAAEGTQATQAASVSEVPASPAGVTVPAPDKGSGECSAALVALSLCSVSTPNQEVKP